MRSGPGQVDHPKMPLSTDRSESDPAVAEPTRRARRARSQRGATMVEYALLVALLALSTIGALTLLQSGAERTAQSSADKISTHTIPTTSTP